MPLQQNRKHDPLRILKRDRLHDRKLMPLQQNRRKNLGKRSPRAYRDSLVI
jgi:hypothetical protein